MRVILRKGHIGHNFYFIYSGSVFVNIEETDNAGEMFSKTEAVLSKGDSFGVSVCPYLLIKDQFKEAHNVSYVYNIKNGGKYVAIVS